MLGKRSGESVDLLKSLEPFEPKQQAPSTQSRSRGHAASCWEGSHLLTPKKAAWELHAATIPLYQRFITCSNHTILMATSDMRWASYKSAATKTCKAHFQFVHVLHFTDLGIACMQKWSQVMSMVSTHCWNNLGTTPIPAIKPANRL